jgi:hypothetical protein
VVLPLSPRASHLRFYSAAFFSQLIFFVFTSPIHAIKPILETFHFIKDLKSFTISYREAKTPLNQAYGETWQHQVGEYKHHSGLLKPGQEGELDLRSHLQRIGKFFPMPMWTRRTDAIPCMLQDCPLLKSSANGPGCKIWTPRLNARRQRLTSGLQPRPGQRIWAPRLNCGGWRLTLGLQPRPGWRIWTPRLNCAGMEADHRATAQTLPEDLDT